MACCDSCAEGDTCVSKSDEHVDSSIEIKKCTEVTWKVQKNFKVQRKIDFQGLDISIEHDKGMIRKWRDRNGEEGQTKMQYPYGYICRTNGADGEQVDCVHPSTKITMADLSIKAAAEVNIGDEVLAFNEFPEGKEHPRRFVSSQITNIRKGIAPSIKFTFQDQSILITTLGHKNLVFSGRDAKWRRSDKIKIGQKFCRLYSVPSEDVTGKVVRFSPLKVEKIEHLQEEFVAIETTAKTYIANGLATHNCYVGPNSNSEKVYVIHQMSVPDFKKYDEDKVMVGFDTPKEAKQAYLSHYNDERFFGTMTQTDLDAFKRMFVNKALKTRKMKRWTRGDKKHCRTGVCDVLDGVTVPEDQPFPYAKNKLGYDVMAPPAHKGCTCKLEYVTQALRRSLDPQMPVDPAAMMMPDPQDVETFEGVQSLINRMGSVKDPELMEIASKIWGEGCNYEGQNPWQARAEILGFLMDQRDLLGVEPALPTLSPSPSLPVKEPLGSSEYYGSSPDAVKQAPPEASSSDEALLQAQSQPSSTPDSSLKPKDKYGGTQ